MSAARPDGRTRKVALSELDKRFQRPASVRLFESVTHFGRHRPKSERRQIEESAPGERLDAILQEANKWNAFGHETRVPRWAASTHGSWCSVPAAIAGDPYAMRRRREVEGLGPVSLAFWNAVNYGGQHWHDDNLVSLCGLACALSVVRPVRVLVFDGCGFDSSHNAITENPNACLAWYVGWPVPVHGTLDPAALAMSMSSPAFKSLMAFEQEQYGSAGAQSGHWPCNVVPNVAGWPTIAAGVRLALQLDDDDIVVPPTFYYAGDSNAAQAAQLAMWRKLTGGEQYDDDSAGGAE